MLTRLSIPLRSLVWLLILIGFSALLPACSPPPSLAEPTQDQEGVIETIVAATITADSRRKTLTAPIASPSPTSTSTPEPAATSTPVLTATPGFNVSGKVCYPDGNIPAMTAFFSQVDSDVYVELQLGENQDRYEVSLPPGSYRAYAWLNDFSRGGLYSKAVPCGLHSECKDHQPLTFSVTAEEAVTGIDLCDWYAGPFNIPEPAGKDAAEITGSISGALAYPGGSPPALNVVAANQTTGYWYYTNTQPGDSSYKISELPPGPYHVVAYDRNERAGGHTGSGHTLIEVQVKAGETSYGVDITDWNAPPGNFPPNPIE